ncbi:MAG: helix-turn-helix transcriptional regulator [Bryobacteraceae bacterium]|nr:helix-turn-helix transcriptional regulator [Bryobacteraceae bacterium]
MREVNQQTAASRPRVTFGQELRVVNLDGFRIIEARHQPLEALGSHYHEEFAISVVTGGGFQEKLSRREYECSRYSILVKPAGEIHANRYGRTGARSLVVLVESARATSLQPFAAVLSRAAHLDRGPFRDLAFRFQREWAHHDSASEIALESLALEMLAEIVREGGGESRSGAPRWLRYAVSYIEAEFGQALTLAGIAAAAGVHPASLARAFRRYLGCSAGAFLRRKRLEFAARELAAGQSALSAIAADAGFYDQSHFTCAFREFAGATPAEYRRAMLTRSHRQS